MFQALMLIIRRINCIDIWYMSLYVSDHLVCRFGRNPENQKKNCVSSWSFTRIMTTFLSEVISCGQFICLYVINMTLLHAFLLQTDTFSPTDRHLFSYRPTPFLLQTDTFFIFVKNETSEMLKNTSPQPPSSQTHMHACMV